MRCGCPRRLNTISNLKGADNRSGSTDFYDPHDVTALRITVAGFFMRQLQGIANAFAARRQPSARDHAMPRQDVLRPR